MAFNEEMKAMRGAIANAPGIQLNVAAGQPNSQPSQKNSEINNSIKKKKD